MLRGAASGLLLPIALLSAGSWPGVAQTPAGASSGTKADRDLGEYLSQHCTACHQASGRVAGAIPSIIGWPEERFAAAMHAFRDNGRANDTMRTIARRFNAEEIAALAAYFGSLRRAD